jgi:hypothetical protein
MMRNSSNITTYVCESVIPASAAGRSANSPVALDMAALPDVTATGATPRPTKHTQNPAPIVHASFGQSWPCHVRDKPAIYTGIVRGREGFRHARNVVAE